MIRGILYFALVFAVGFVLGVVRVLWLVPQLGERGAELLEAPFMLAAIVLSARLVVRRYPAESGRGYLASGALALLLLAGAEVFVVLGLRGLSFSQYVADRDPVAGAVYLLMLMLFALMPWLVGRRLALPPLPVPHDRGQEGRP